MKIPTSLYWRTKSMLLFKGLYKSIGDIESWILKAELETVEIKSPIYIASLARSGTTILTEILAQLDDVCSHTYGDFPGVFTPYWNNWLRQKKSFLHEEKAERAHGDRILIDNNSPEAFEEVLWMYFFSELHKRKSTGISFAANTNFVKCYQQHIKKHLLVKNKKRYISKANYNINRVDELLKIFPDAKFIIPIRHPINHIASLMKQHEKFTNAAKNNSKIDTQLAASGHFEFGNLREIIQVGNDDYTSNISQLWADSQDVLGWAMYWKGFYQGVIELQKKHPLSVKVIKYEELCGKSEEVISEVFEFCELAGGNEKDIKHKYNQQLSLPDYYTIAFKPKEIAQIIKICQAVTEIFGYNAENFN